MTTTPPIETFRAALQLPADVQAGRQEDYGRIMAHVMNDMPVPELAALWRALQRIGVRGDTPETGPVRAAFDTLWLENAKRAYAMVLDVLRTESERNTVLALGEGPLFNLLDRHMDKVGERIAVDAQGNAGLRRLLGAWVDACAAVDEADPVAARLCDIADLDGWEDDVAARQTSEPPIDFDALSDAALAVAWLDQWNRPTKDLTDNWHAILDLEPRLAAADPARLLRVVIEMVRQECSEALLSTVAMQAIELLCQEAQIDAVALAARREPIFGRWLIRQNLALWPKEHRDLIRQAVEGQG